MQCLGNWDARKGSNGLHFMNRVWVWKTFDAFWVAIAGPCFQAASYVFSNGSQIHSINSGNSVASLLKIPFSATGSVLLKGTQWAIELIASFPSDLHVVVQDPLAVTWNLVAKCLQWPIWLINSCVGYFDYVPYIKNAFAVLGDWLSNITSTLATMLYWQRILSGFRIPVRVIENAIDGFYRFSLAIIDLLRVLSCSFPS